MWEFIQRMKKLILVLAVFLSGCSTLSELTQLWPKPHDPVMFDQVVSVKLALDKVNCDDKNWTDVENKVHHLKVYSELRNDPQAKSIGQMQEAITRAKASDKKLFCESILKFNKTRVDVIIDAWKGR